MSNLNYISPFFIVANIKESVSYYINKLGFELRFLGPGDDPFFAIVGRDHISIMLKSVGDDVKPRPNSSRHGAARWDAYIYASDPDDLFDEYKSSGLSFQQSIKDDDDGLRGFEIQDADGYVLFFGKPIAQ